MRHLTCFFTTALKLANRDAAGEVQNNGTYTWNGADSASLATACNYTVRLSVDGLVAYSEYFAINADDGPLADDATCPGEQGQSRPQVDGNSAVLGSKSNTGSASNGGGGISTSTLAVAIVIPIVVLLAAFALIIWLGIRRGWFVKWTNRRAEKAHLTHENTAGFGDGGGDGGNIAWQSAQFPTSSPVAATMAEKRLPASNAMEPTTGENEPQELHSTPAMAEKRKPVGSSRAPAYSDQPQELHAEGRAWETEGREVHQLEGDERDARWGDGYMRG